MHVCVSDLLRIRKLQRVTLEFTSRCNLRCTYCAVAQPFHQDRDLDLSQFDSLMKEFQELGVEYVQISGAGETTVVKNWDYYLYQLVDAGFKVSIITNFAKPMPERAALALSRCVEITTSCDTVDPELFNAIRTRGDFRMFLHNILRIRALAIEQGRPAPRLVWNMVANDKTILGVERWVATGIALGIDHFQISEMTKFAEIEGAFSVQPVGTMSPEDLVRAGDAVERGRQLAAASGKAFNVLPFLEEVLAGTRKSLWQIVNFELGPDGRPAILSSRKFVEYRDADGTRRQETVAAGAPSPDRLTRNCVLPWTEACFWSTRKVTACCLTKGHAIFNGSGVLEAVNSPAFVEIREGLLTGNPVADCHTCTMAGTVEPEVLRQRVAELMQAQGDL